jgi:ABC-2 type transport system permease protein
MKNILAIMGKEMKIYFYSPMAYVVIAVFLLINGYLFYTIVGSTVNQAMQMIRFQQSLPQININDMILRPVYHNMAVVMILTLPMLTMRLLSEEKKTRTAELLLTSPITLTQIVLGKFLSAMLVFSLALLLCGFMPVLLDSFGTLSWAPVLAAYLGLLLLGGVFLSLGLFASSLTENQVIAGLVGFALILMLWLLGWIAQVGSDVPLGPFFSFISVGEHFDNFVRGLIDSSDLIYFLSLIVVGLFLTHRVLDSQRWR